MRARRYRLLGGLEVIDGAVHLDLGTRKQRSLLAALLLADGQVVTTDRLTAVLWGDDPPDRYEASLQSYVSTLRRTLEPERAPRAAPTILVTRGAGYALLAEPDEVDVRRFLALVEQGRARHAAGELPAAATVLRNALATYAPLLPEFDGEEFRDTAADHVGRVHEAALELSYEVRLALGEERLLVTDLEAAVRRHPLNEGMWALLATARYRLGHQADALRAVADCKRILAEEIGVDPGPRLRRLEADLLAHAPHLDGREHVSAPVVEAPAQPVPGPRPAAPQHVASPLVGRRDELRVLADAVTDTFAGGQGLVIVEGEPGVGKTRLLEEVCGDAADRRAVVVWGRCLDGDGTPAMWPWIQAVRELLGCCDTATREELLSGELGRLLEPRGDRVTAGSATILPDAGAQFRLFELAADVVARVAADRPVLLVIDDLQWADPASLQLFEHLAERLLRGTLLVGALRDKAPTPNDELSRALAAASRLPGLRRVRLGPLAPDEVGALVALETGSAPDAEQAAVLRTRTGGNPFFVRELARLLRDAGGLGAPDDGTVPSGVRDVVRGRMAGLDPAAKSLLQIAAVIGRDVDLGLLARSADLDVEECLDLLEPVEALGLMSPSPGNPFAFRFAHDLVRESVAESTPALRVTRLHLKVAGALEGGGADRSVVIEQLAHHLWSAGPLADRQRTAEALIEAGRVALNKYAYASAERQLGFAVDLARTGGLGELELAALTLLSSVVGMRRGYVGTAVELLERAETLARELGLVRRAADFLYARWASYSQGIRLDLSGPLAQRLRDDGEASDDPVVRMYGAHAWGIHQWDVGNIGESYRWLLKADATSREHLSGPVDDDSFLRWDLVLLAPAMLAQMTALHGDLAGGRRLLDWMERELTGDPYGLMVWGAFSATIAAQSGEPAWAKEVGARSMAADPDFAFVFLGTYQRMSYWYGRALLGEDPDEAIARIRELIDSMPDDPPRSGLATWCTLLAEALLANGRVEEAGAALDRAEHYLERYGQRYCEGLTLLMRARWLHAGGADAETVRAALDRARRLATEREAFLFVQRADAFEATL